MKETDEKVIRDMSMEEVEKALICCLLTSAEAPVLVETRVEATMFADSALGFVYEAIMAVYGRGIRPDMVAVEAEMRRADEGQFKQLGGLSFLLPYMLNVRHDGNVTFYADEVKRQYKLRCLVSLFSTLAYKSGQFASVAETLVEEAERSLLQFRMDTREGEPLRTVGALAAEAMEWHRKRLSAECDGGQLLSDLTEFDYVTGGFFRSELTVLAGRPSDGKTAVALQMALNVARGGAHVCFFSLEMSSLQMLNRILGGMTNVDADRLRILKPDEKDLSELERATKQLQDLPFYLDYTSGNTVEGIRAKAMVQHKMGKCDFVVVDYLHLLGGTRQKGETLEQVVGRNIVALKQLALDINCPVLVVSQMNRACMTRGDKTCIPVMSDLRDSGTIEQVADCVVFVYRPERYGVIKDEATGQSLVGVGRLYVVKNRNGATGIARFRYNPSFTRITNYITATYQTRLDL